MVTPHVIGIPSITIHVRHSASCPQKAKGEFVKNCKCKKHLRWHHKNKLYRVSAKTRTWEGAERARRVTEAGLGSPTIRPRCFNNFWVRYPTGSHTRLGIAEHIELFLARKAGKQSQGVQSTYRRQLTGLQEFLMNDPLSHDLLNGTLDLAFLTGIPETSQISSVSVAKQRFFVVMLEQDDLSRSTEITADQLRVRSCVLFDRHVHPYLYDNLVQRARPATVPGTSLYHVTTAEEASQFVSRGLGVAVITQAGAWRIAREGITIRPLADEDLVLETKLACRSDNQARVVSEFVRAFVRSLSSTSPQRQSPLSLAG